MDPILASPPVTTPTPAPAPAAQARGIASDFDTFLRMLTVQMRNQDPLDPIDSADYAVQLATFSGVEQQVRTNELLAALGSQMGLGGLAEMGAWVGREARAAGPAYFDGSPLTVQPRPLAAADAAELVVRDAAGAEVGRFPVPLPAQAVDWAGMTADGAPLPPGTYRFDVTSSSAGQILGTAPAEVYGRVAEVRIEGGGHAPRHGGRRGRPRHRRHGPARLTGLHG